MPREPDVQINTLGHLSGTVELDGLAGHVAVRAVGDEGLLSTSWKRTISAMSICTDTSCLPSEESVGNCSVVHVSSRSSGPVVAGNVANSDALIKTKVATAAVASTTTVVTTKISKEISVTGIAIATVTAGIGINIVDTAVE